MAEKRTSRGVPAAPGSNNLLFSTGELNFTVPFLPVTGPLPAGTEDVAEVGEEDSFLGQTCGVSSPPQTFSYFSQAASLSSSSDPFASIGLAQTSVSVSTMPSGPAVSVSPSSAIQNEQNVASPPKAVHPYSPNTLPLSTLPDRATAESAPIRSPQNAFSAPPMGLPNVPFNPYRHNTQSSRANPYLTPPQLQQDHIIGTSSQTSPLAPHIYQPSYGIPATPPRAPDYMTAPATPPYPSAPAAVLAPPPFMPSLYEPVQPHWFFCRVVEGREVWSPFSMYDSSNLEEVYNSVQPDPESVMVRTAGGRYDVCLYDREMRAVYWEEETSEVRRCSWFYKGDTDSRFVPYSEDFSERLEAEYKKAGTTGQWHRRLEFPGGETIVMHNPKVIVQFQQSSIPDEWGTPQDGQSRPRVVKRGIDDHDEIPDGEPPQADHLVFMVHGIGPVCDLRFRSMVECVDDFRAVSLKLLQTHFRKSVEECKVRRVEFLPVHWHSALHGDATGVDRRIRKISLPSIGRLRHFTNETLLDILFYNSPTYCQTIVDKVSLEMNRLYELFMSRNPDFHGGVSVAGHSLGSLILFDILSNQQKTQAASAAPLMQIAPTNSSSVVNHEAPGETPVSVPITHDPSEPDLLQEGLPKLQDALDLLSLSEYAAIFNGEKIDMESLLLCTVEDLKEMGIPLGPRKKIAKYIKEVAASQKEKKAPTDKRVPQNITENTNASGDNSGLEPAKRILPVGASVSSINVNYEHFETGTGQVSVRYNSLDFKLVNFFALGSPIGIFLTVRGVNKIDESYRLPTCTGFFNIYHPLDPVAYRLEPMIMPDFDLKPVLIPHHKGRKRLHLELKESLSRMGSDLKQGFISSLRSAWQTLNEFARFHTSSAQLQAELEKVASQIKEEEDKQVEVENTETCREEDLSIKIGMLNGGRRIDYVLQEKPIESFNEYLFALQSHLCYWESEDTALLILKEIYKSVNVHPDQPLH